VLRDHVGGDDRCCDRWRWPVLWPVATAGVNSVIRPVSYHLSRLLTRIKASLLVSSGLIPCPLDPRLLARLIILNACLLKLKNALRSARLLWLTAIPNTIPNPGVAGSQVQAYIIQKLLMIVDLSLILAKYSNFKPQYDIVFFFFDSLL
jgi:hypothetical protein